MLYNIIIPFNYFDEELSNRISALDAMNVNTNFATLFDYSGFIDLEKDVFKDYFDQVITGGLVLNCSELRSKLYRYNPEDDYGTFIVKLLLPTLLDLIDIEAKSILREAPYDVDFTGLTFKGVSVEDEVISVVVG